jgi:hypothetical protein
VLGLGTQAAADLLEGQQAVVAAEQARCKVAPERLSAGALEVVVDLVANAHWVRAWPLIKTCRTVP